MRDLETQTQAHTLEAKKSNFLESMPFSESTMPLESQLSSESTPLFELSHITYSARIHRFFGARFKEILHDVNLRVDSGERLGIMGKSGSGKSTLARVCAALTHHNDLLLGERKLLGKEVCLKTLAQRRAFYSQVQILLQDSLSSLNPRLNVFENLCEGLIYLKNIRNKHEQLERIMPLMERLSLGEAILEKRVGMLSGGEAQRVCLARALLLEPQILILDESLSGLDYELSMQVVEFLLQWQSTTWQDLQAQDTKYAKKSQESQDKRGQGSAIITIGHNHAILKALCGENILTMSSGRLYPKSFA